MATSAETMRTQAMLPRYAKAIENGLSLVSPLLNFILVGPTRSARKLQLFSNKWTNVKWGGVSGDGDYKWLIVTEEGTATVNRGQLRTRDFDEPNILDTATVNDYNIEHTAAIGSGDKERNKRDKTQLARIFHERVMYAQNAIRKKLASWVWNTSETNQNAGFGYVADPDNADSNYAGIALSDTEGTRDYWRPRHWDYGSAYTLEADWPTIVSEMVRKLTFSSTPGGGGPELRPNFAVSHEDAWPKIMGWYNAKAAWNINGGNHPTNANLMEDGFDNIVANGVTYFVDDNYPSAGLKGGTSDEVIFGTTKVCHFATHASRKQGFIQSQTMNESPLVSGDLAVFKTGQMVFRIALPCRCGLAYT